MLRSFWNQILGRGEAAVTIPSLDGAFRPNQVLDHAHTMLTIDAPDNLVNHAGRVLFSSGSTVYAVAGPGMDAVETFPRDVTALAVSPDGLLAVGLENGGVVFRGSRSVDPVLTLDGQDLVCPTACLFLDEKTLIICAGSASNPPSEWVRDLMSRRATGSVWRFELRQRRATCLASGLGYPNGIFSDPRGAVFISESWRHRILEITSDAMRPPRVALGDIPGYPGRLAKKESGGAWLSVFAPRSQLIEFVLRESGYRNRMMREVPPSYWIAPALASGRSFYEPMQGGAVKQMGILKPWAPTRSYGLVVGLDGDMQAQQSFHSRADGERHGIVSRLETASGLIVASKGANALLTISRAEWGHHEAAT